MNTTPTQPPQGVMAPAEALAVLDQLQFGFAHRRCPICAGFNCGPNGETDKAHTKECPVPKARATFAGLLDEVEALRAENAKLLGDWKAERECSWKWNGLYTEAARKGDALLARCEGLEAALRETVETAETAIELAQRDGAIYDGTELDAARTLLAATRTTGD